MTLKVTKAILPQKCLLSRLSIPQMLSAHPQMSAQKESLRMELCANINRLV